MTDSCMHNLASKPAPDPAITVPDVETSPGISFQEMQVAVGKPPTDFFFVLFRLKTIPSQILPSLFISPMV